VAHARLAYELDPVKDVVGDREAVLIGLAAPALRRARGDANEHSDLTEPLQGTTYGCVAQVRFEAEAVDAGEDVASVEVAVLGAVRADELDGRRQV